MDEVVFILGAGASASSGAPLMNNFLDVARNIMLRGESDIYEQDFKRVFDAIGALQAVHSKAKLDLTNLESIFTTFEMASLLGKLPGTSSDNDISEIVISLKKVIVHTLEKTVLFPLSSNGTLLPTTDYKGFAQLLLHIQNSVHPPNRTSVITFNYDIALDLALLQARKQVDYCTDTAPKNDQNAVKVLKLHGSLHWARKKHQNGIAIASIADHLNGFRDPLSSYAKTTPVVISRELSSLCNEEVDASPVIIPPTWDKSSYYNFIQPVWRAAANCLSRASQIYVIGYSLPDTDYFFRLLYALGTVGTHPLQHFGVYDIDESRVEDRFRSVLGDGAIQRFEYHCTPFNSAIGNIKELYKTK